MLKHSACPGEALAQTLASTLRGHAGTSAPGLMTSLVLQDHSDRPLASSGLLLSQRRPAIPTRAVDQAPQPELEPEPAHEPEPVPVSSCFMASRLPRPQPARQDAPEPDSSSGEEQPGKAAADQLGHQDVRSALTPGPLKQDTEQAPVLSQSWLIWPSACFLILA